MPDFSKWYIDRPRFRPGSLKAYLAAFALVAVGTLLCMAMEPLLSDVPFLLPFMAVVATLFISGGAAAALAVALSVASVWIFEFLPSISYDEVYRTGVFLVGCVTVMAVTGIMRASLAQVNRLNETLRISEGKFRDLLESAPDAVVIVDDRHRILLVNARAEALFGYRRTELLGRPAEMLLPERSQEKYLARLAPVAASRYATAAIQIADLYGARKDGAEFPIELSLSSLQAETGMLISSTIRDVTARKEIEVNLAEASRAKSIFLASMSHELRTPLNAILGFADLLKVGRESALTAKQREYVDHIREGGDHLLGLVSQLLDMAAIETGRLDLSIDRVNVRAMLSKVHGLMMPFAQTSGVVFELNVPDEIADVVADELRLRQALLNLLSNAMKYNRPEGGVMLTALPAPDGQVRFAVSDTGIGIPVARQKDVFQPFQRLGAEHSHIDGTGIGLALSRRLIEAMNGRIGFVSAPGEGSVFWVELPAMVADSAAVADIEPTAMVH